VSTALATVTPVGADIERVLIAGDLSKLTPDQRLSYYRAVCESVGLNPLTRPFDYLTLNGKLVLYAKKDATDQLRKIHGVSITDIQTHNIGDVFVVTAKAVDATGRTDVATGAVAIGGLKADALANSIMKSETKAKRRVTLSICGLGMLDETELETIPDARRSAAPAEEPRRIEEPRRKSEAPPEPTIEEIEAALDAGETPADAHRPPGLYVEAITEKTGSNSRGPWTLWRVTMSDGETYGTFSETFADLASAAKRGTLPVSLQFKTTAKGGKELTEFEVLA
jgi:hypothetical protein